jgi:hypothetical protein
VSTDEQHIALPKLYGAPAYARPQAVVETGPRPFDPDELPIEALQTEEDRAFAASLPARAWAPGGAVIDGSGSRGDGDGDAHLRPRPFTLRSIAGRLLGGA